MLCADRVITPQPVAAWLFNGNTADAIDSLYATARDITYAADRHGAPAAAAQFNGRGQWVQAPSLEAMIGDNPDGWSLVLWFKTDKPERSMTLFSDSGVRQMDFGYGMNLDITGGKVRFSLRGERYNDIADYNLHSSPIQAGQWHCVIAVANRAGGMASLYLDGQLSEQLNFYRAFDYIDDDPCQIGQRVWSGGQSMAFDGLIDDMRVFPEALDTSAVKFYSEIRP